MRGHTADQREWLVWSRTIPRVQSLPSARFRFQSWLEDERIFKCFKPHPTRLEAHQKLVAIRHRINDPINPIYRDEIPRTGGCEQPIQVAARGVMPRAIVAEETVIARNK